MFLIHLQKKLENQSVEEVIMQLMLVAQLAVLSLKSQTWNQTIDLVHPKEVEDLVKTLSQQVETSQS